MIVGYRWTPDSCVQLYELDFIRDAIAPGDVVEIEARPDRPLRPDRLYMPAHVAKHFVVERVSTAQGRRDPLNIGVLHADLSVNLCVRSIASAPERFIGKMIGDALR